jgi:predicted ATPase/DNA-binding SARP family transcriptional activator/uncharacterized protein HemY
MPTLSLSLLGPLQAALDGELVTGFATDKTQALLAYLAIEADHPHRRDALAGLLWPDQPQKKARHNLRQTLSYLRQALSEDNDCDAPFLLIKRETIQFNPDCSHLVDVSRFTALVEACNEHHHRRIEACLPCLRRLEEMGELYQGEFLEQFFLQDSETFEEWATLKREWLHREAVEALYHLANHRERRGDYKKARQYAHRQVTLEPWREEAHRQLMRLLALDGQRSAALAQYEACRRALAEELGVEPTAETTTLYEQIRSGEREKNLLRSPAPLLPYPSTPFVGREAELTELTELLADPDCRLVTVFGPGGIGKTRLALQTAADYVGAFADGVAFVPLAAVNSVERLPSAIADVLRVPPYGAADPREQLLDYLHEKEMLLLLDNMEHLLDGNTLLSAILQRAPDVVLLITSRERLNLQEEWVYEIEGLTYPPSSTEAKDRPYSAVELFQQCARRANRRFIPSETELVHVARICRLVEGMPLGIELAAAWMTVHTCEEIAQEIEHSLDILTTRLQNIPERHRSVWATFEHSWQLLSDAEKTLFAKLAVFRGGFSREAASQVAGADPATLAALLDQSLIRRAAPDRYDMHEMLRQYAYEKLHDNPDLFHETQMHQARYFAGFLGQREKRLKGTEQRQILTEIGREIENARQAWQVAVTGEHIPLVEQGMESLYYFCRVRGRFQEGIDLLNLAVEKWNERLKQTPLFGQILARQGILLQHLGRHHEAQAALERGMKITERTGSQVEQAFCLLNLAEVNRSQGRYKETVQLAQQSLDLCRQLDDPCGVARALHTLGAVYHRIGRVDQAETLLEECLVISQACDHQRLAMTALNGLGDIAAHRGAYGEAQLAFEACLALSREIDDQFNAAMHLNNLGTVVHVLGQYSEAQSYYQESLDICHRIGDRNGQAIALSNLGEIAHTQGKYRKALAYYEEALAIGRAIDDQRSVLVCLNNLGETACTMEDFDTANTYLVEALRLASENQTMIVLTKVLVNLAALFAEQGQVDRSATLLAVARQQPGCEQDTKDKAKQMLSELEVAPPEPPLPSLEAIVIEVLAELSPAESGDQPPSG